jgi:hypothetical protein
LRKEAKLKQMVKLWLWMDERKRRSNLDASKDHMTRHISDQETEYIDAARPMTAMRNDGLRKATAPET